MKAIPIGISDYKEFYDEDYYYVDKTLMIKEILDNKGKVNLFTRPRRFGKTLNLSMIKYFFEKTEENNSYLFKDKKIWKTGEKYIEQQGKYPIINLDFKSIEGLSWDEAYLKLKNMLSNEYTRYYQLLDESVFYVQKDRDTFEKICNKEATEVEYTYSLKNLCVYLERYHKQKPIILIDEYDVPLQRAYLNGYYKEAINFIRGLLQDALKTNDSLEFAIMTGCLRISKESIFTGLNNLKIISILDRQYDEHFGFLQTEVDELLKYYNLEDKKQEIQEWYDGYQFGSKDIYNPWSILNYVDGAKTNHNKLPEAYWINTSGNDIVKKLIEKSDDKTRNEIELLINGKTIEKSLNANITYNELDNNINNIWSMLFFTGYLTYTKERREGRTSYYTLKIPNEELLYIYETVIHYWFKEIVKEKNLKPLFESFINGDTGTATSEINGLLQQSISYNDKAENFYHGFLVGILQNIQGYRVKSNRESGLGRSDIFLIPFVRANVCIVIEIKTAKKFKEIEKLLDDALKQIDDKKYTMDLEDDGYNNIIKYGIVFYDKECKIKRSPII